MKRRLLVFSLIAFLAACGGGGGGPLPSGGGGGTGGGGGGGNTYPTPPPSSSQTLTLGGTPTTFTLPQINTGVSATVTVPGVSGGAKATITLLGSLPSSIPQPSMTRLHHARPNTLGAKVSAIAYFQISVSGAVTLTDTPEFALTFLEGTLNGYSYEAFYDPTNAAAGWNALVGPLGVFTSANTSVDFASTPLTLPIALQPNVNYYVAITESSVQLPTGGASVPGTAPTLPPVESASGGWSPYDVAHTLKYPVQSGWDGTGQTVAIVMDQYPASSDVAAYQNYFNVPVSARHITFTPSPDGTPNPANDAGEVTLDAETVAGLAPGANIIVYGIPSLTQQDFIDTVNYITTNKTASVISFSAGGCEYNGQTPSSVFAAAAQAGIAIIASAGDQGNECYNGSYAVGVNYPASDPSVTGLGGTETNAPTYNLYSNTVWNDTSCVSGQCAGGGGVSANFTTPSYQQGLAGASQSGRNVPDVSLPAEDDAVYQGGWGLVNGTSWSAPQYAALMAELYEYCQTAVVNPVTIPYYVYGADSTSFIDVAQGNDQFGTSTPFYSAGSGYDNAGGLGVPYGMQFANTMCPQRTLAARFSRHTGVTPMLASAQHTTAYAANVTPRVAGVYDEGRRPVETLTRVQITIPFRANASNDERAVVQSLRAAGFSIARTFGNHLVVDAVAPSGIVEQYFSTEMHNVLQGRYGTRYMPVRQALVPSDIAPHIASVNLDDVVTMRKGIEDRELPF